MQMRHWPLFITLFVFSLYLAEIADRPRHEADGRRAGAGSSDR